LCNRVLKVFNVITGFVLGERQRRLTRAVGRLSIKSKALIRFSARATQPLSFLSTPESHKAVLYFFIAHPKYALSLNYILALSQRSPTAAASC